MAKLTEEQKAQNKADRKVRDAAYRARYKAYQAELKIAEKLTEESPSHAETRQACAAIEEVIVERNKKEAELEVKIAALRAEQKSLQQEFSIRMDALRAQRDAAYKVKRAYELKLREEIDARYPDMVDCHSAAGWTPPTA